MYCWCTKEEWLDDYEDLCFITRWCEVVHDDEVNDDNVFFKPTKWAIQTKNFRR